MNTPIILGVDPGATGALAGLDAATGHLIWVEAMPMLAGLSIVSGPELADMLANEITVTAYVERVHSMPKQGVSSSFKFGSAYGGVATALGALRVPVELVPPEVWKPAVGLRKVAGESKAGAKARARAMATSLWPDRSAWFASVAKGTAAAEAALIARHGWLLRNRERVA